MIKTRECEVWEIKNTPKILDPIILENCSNVYHFQIRDNIAQVVFYPKTPLEVINDLFCQFSENGNFGQWNLICML